MTQNESYGCSLYPAAASVATHVNVAYEVANTLRQPGAPVMSVNVAYGTARASGATTCVVTEEDDTQVHVYETVRDARQENRNHSTSVHASVIRNHREHAT